MKIQKVKKPKDIPLSGWIIVPPKDLGNSSVNDLIQNGRTLAPVSFKYHCTKRNGFLVEFEEIKIAGSFLLEDSKMFKKVEIFKQYTEKESDKCTYKKVDHKTLRNLIARYPQVLTTQERLKKTMQNLKNISTHEARLISRD